MELPIFWCLKILSTYTDSSQMAICGGFHKKGWKWRAEGLGGKKKLSHCLGKKWWDKYHIISYHKYYPLSIIHIISYNIIIHFVPWFFFGGFPMFSTTEDKKGCSLSSLLETTDEGSPPWGPGAVVFSVQFLSANHDNLLQLTTTCCLKIS